MNATPVTPPQDVVTVLPAGRTVFGMQLPVQSQSTIYVQPWETSAGPEELAQVTLACEAAGFFYVGVCDHTFIPSRLAGAMGTTWYDTIATLGWLAGITTDIHLLSHVYVIALRHPLRAAKEFATLDVLSGGRVVCGVGAGHVAEEFELMGPEFDHRGSATDEAITGLAAGLATEYPVLDGARWKASDVGLKPRPVQSPRPPIWVGGSSPAALKRAARFGDGWLPQSLGPNVELLGTLRRLRDEFRDGAPLDIGGIADPIYVGTPPDRLELPKGTVAGPADLVAAYLRPFAEAGVGQVQVRFPSRSAAELCDQIATFGREVAPLVAH
ncbi:MAG: TIGR03619 family F420-dependent LLM class oxidoreductase [Acidimicrobiales bacterium]